MITDSVLMYITLELVKVQVYEFFLFIPYVYT